MAWELLEVTFILTHRYPMIELEVEVEVDDVVKAASRIGGYLRSFDLLGVFDDFFDTGRRAIFESLHIEREASV